MIQTAVHGDLFGTDLHLLSPGAPGASGFELAPNFVTPKEEAALIARIDAEQLTPFKYRQWEGKRLTAGFGWRYDFLTGRLDVGPPFPDWLLPVRDRAAVHIGVAPDDFVQALLIRYDPGAGIGWHKDRPAFEHIVGISLGQDATLRLRRRRPGGFDRTKAKLSPRSIYHLTGEARHQWEHSIAPMDVPRWSITFRTLSDAGKNTGLRP